MINGKLAKLYDEWERKNPDHFVRGGILNEKAYRESRPRIVWLNKEPNDPSHEDWDQVTPSGDGQLQTFTKERLEGRRHYEVHNIVTYKQAGLWSYGILKGFPAFDKLVQERNAAEGLERCGWTNLKKAGGSSVSNYREIREYARKQLGLWTKELMIMDAELVLCGDTYLIVAELLKLRRNRLFEVPNGEYDYSTWQVNGHDCLIVDLPHPGSRKGYKNNYLTVGKVFRNLHDHKACFWE